MTSQRRGELLELKNQKGVSPNEYMNSFKKFFNNRRPNKCEYYNSLKD